MKTLSVTQIFILIILTSQSLQKQLDQIMQSDIIIPKNLATWPCKMVQWVLKGTPH